MGTYEHFMESVSMFRSFVKPKPRAQVERRPPDQRWERRARDKAGPQARNLDRAGRERRQRNSRHKRNTVTGKIDEMPFKAFGERFRKW